MAIPITPDRLRAIKAYCEAATPSQYIRFTQHARTDLPALVEAYEGVVRERDVLVHSAALIQADLQGFVTDCSTPTFQLVRNMLERMAVVERERDTPGEWVCPVCSFLLHKRILQAETGLVGINTKDESELCPNDGATMRRFTWKEVAELAEDAARRFAEEAVALRAERDTLKARVAELEGEVSTWIDQWAGLLPTKAIRALRDIATPDSHESA